jgi:hypothetical protein
VPVGWSLRADPCVEQIRQKQNRPDRQSWRLEQSQLRADGIRLPKCLKKVMLATFSYCFLLRGAPDRRAKTAVKLGICAVHIEISPISGVAQTGGQT